MIGTGYVGLTTGACFADLGNEVLCVDIDEEKIENLKKGIIPIFEPGLDEVVKKNFEKNTLKFTSNSKEAIESCDLIFIAVGTPPGEDDQADLSAVKAVGKDIGKNMNSYKVIITKSTVPVGTADMLKEVIKENQTEPFEFDVVSNPEFLREGSAVEDFMHPDRVVAGLESEQAKNLLQELYNPVTDEEHPILFTDLRSSELIKYASNAMLATRISFINELALLCDEVGGDIETVAKGMGFDKRIGPSFLKAGAGFGGSCFPKDVKALAKTMQGHGVDSKMLKTVLDVNQHQRKVVVDKVRKLLPDLKNKKVGVWGLSFKPKTDDMREAPSLTVMEVLNNLGADLKAFDPVAEPNAKLVMPNVQYCPTPFEAVEDCDCLVIMTEWPEFKDLDKNKIKSLLKEPNIVDARNIFNPKEMRDLGFNYLSVGRA